MKERTWLSIVNLACLCCFHLLCLITLSGCGCRNNLIGSAADTSFFSKSLMSVVVGSISLNLRPPQAAFQNTITEGSPMGVVKNVRICNLPEYQSNNIGDVALESCVHSVWDFLAWGNDAQVNLVSVLQQCIEIGVSISSESFYCACGAYEAPFGECLARVLEQDSNGKGLIRSALGDYFVRRYPGALIEMHVLSRENNAIFCGFGCGPRKLQSFVHVDGLHNSGANLEKSDNREDYREFCNRLIRRFVVTLVVLVISCFVMCSRLIENWLVCLALIVSFGACMLSVVLSSERWTWWWW